MDANYKKQWVEALRSGEYEQGPGQLKTPSGAYCCLGVLCDIVAPSGWGTEFQGYDGVPPKRLTDDVGLEAVHIGALVTMNDAHRKNFNQIADYIEEKV